MITTLRIFAFTVLAAAVSAQQPPPPAATPVPPGGNAVFDGAPAPSLLGPSPRMSMLDQVESAMSARQTEDEGESNKRPDELDTFDFRGQSLEKVFRILARRARMNLIIPPIKGETISLRLENTTPRQAFIEVARVRGFRIVESGTSVTVTRSDIAVPPTFTSQVFTLHEVAADFALQPVANLLGLDLTAPQSASPILPKPENTPSATSSVADAQGRARFTPAVPIDEPSARKGGGGTAGAAAGGSGAAGPAGAERSANVFVVRRTNQLVVTAIPEDLDRVRDFLRSFDRYVPQVRLTAYILEITEADDNRTGFDWSSSLGPTGLQLGLTRSSSNGGFTPPIYEFAKGFFIQGAILDSTNLTTVLRALHSNNRTRLVATPTTIVTPGIPTQLQAINKETFAVTTNDLSGGVARQNVVLQTFVTGLTLDATVRVLPNGMLPLNINPQLSTKTGVNKTPIGDIPIISQRGLTNDLMVPDGSAVVLGGVVNLQDEQVRNGIPFLKDVPLVKYLFSSKGRQTSRSNLVIIVHAETLAKRGAPLARYGRPERELVQDAVGGMPGEPAVPTVVAERVVRTVPPVEDPKTVRKRTR